MRKGGFISDDLNILLFSYGTLQLEAVQISSFGRLLTGQKDAMPGYRTDMVEIMDLEVVAKSGKKFHPILVASGNPDDQVQGMVFEITAAEPEAADRYEVSDYKRVELPLASGKWAWVYIKA